MICGHSSRPPLNSNVPLSCVPPMSRWEFFALTEKLWNCRVGRFLFIGISWFGTRDRSDLQNAVSAALRPRESHLYEVSANLPSERTTPPSDAEMNSSGLPGTVTRAWW